MEVPLLKRWVEDLSGENRILKTEIISLRNEIDPMRLENNSLKTENEGLKLQNDSLKTENEGLKLEIDALRAVEQENKKLKEENDSLKVENYSLKDEISSLQGTPDPDSQELAVFTAANDHSDTDSANIDDGNGYEKASPSPKRRKMEVCVTQTRMTEMKLSKKGIINAENSGSMNYRPHTRALGRRGYSPVVEENVKGSKSFPKIKFSFPRDRDRVMKKEDKIGKAKDKGRRGKGHPKKQKLTGTVSPNNGNAGNDVESKTYEVERILDVRSKNGGLEFLAKWGGYKEIVVGWEPQENFECQDLLNEFMDSNEFKEFLESSSEPEVSQTPTPMQTVDKKKLLWCSCNQPHNNRFMITCDRCGDWYHGSCVGVRMGQCKTTKVNWLCLSCNEWIMNRLNVESGQTVETKKELIKKERNLRDFEDVEVY